jgi:hypothetical protein
MMILRESRSSIFWISYWNKQILAARGATRRATPETFSGNCLTRGNPSRDPGAFSGNCRMRGHPSRDPRGLFWQLPLL